MGVISTPPSPAAENCSSCRVMLARSTALPGHHQRVQGFVVSKLAGVFDLLWPAKPEAASARQPSSETIDRNLMQKKESRVAVAAIIPQIKRRARDLCSDCQDRGGNDASNRRAKLPVPAIPPD